MSKNVSAKIKTAADDVYRIATARFVVQMASDADPMDFGSLISAEPGLRQLNDATSRANENLAELGIEIEYGPARGTLDATLSAILRHLVKQRADITASEVFNYRHRVATKAELQAEHARLEAESDDMLVPLRQRKELLDRANELRKYVGE